MNNGFGEKIAVLSDRGRKTGAAEGHPRHHLRLGHRPVRIEGTAQARTAFFLPPRSTSERAVPARLFLQSTVHVSTRALAPLEQLLSGPNSMRVDKISETSLSLQQPPPNATTAAPSRGRIGSTWLNTAPYGPSPSSASDQVWDATRLALGDPTSQYDPPEVGS